MYKPRTLFAKHALDTIVTYVKTKNIDELKSRDVLEEFNEKLACFVSIHNNDESLRGCIGTIEPREDNLWLEIISNAVSACSRDSRFSAIETNELDQIEVSVDVLSKPEKVEDLDKLDPKKYGVIVTDGNYMRGVLLPDIEGVDTVEEQIKIAKRKAGLADMENEFLKIYSFTSTRYH
ncbi:MAG: AmmeMemoRadiSam system protein A [Bacteroidota bacterium]